jgi:hypothetical protein
VLTSPLSQRTNLPGRCPEVTSSGTDVIVPAATPLRQSGRKYMSKRSGQKGQVKLRNGRWIGRYYVDVFGQSKRVRPAVVLGMKHELTKSEAKLKLWGIITEAGVNTPGHLERSIKPLVTFGDVADASEAKRLPQLKMSTQYAAPQQIAKHLRPFFGALPLESIKTGTVNDWISGLGKKELEPKTVHNPWKQFRAIMNWHSQQSDEPKRGTLPCPIFWTSSRDGSRKMRYDRSLTPQRDSTNPSFILPRSAVCVLARSVVYMLRI